MTANQFPDLASKIEHARTLPRGSYDPANMPFHNIGDMLRTNAAESPDRVWLIFYPDIGGRIEVSYLRFYEMVCRTANLMTDLGVRKGDRIATVAHNHLDTVVQYYSALLIGAVVVPINIGEDDKRIAYILEHSKIRLIFSRAPYTHRVQEILLISDTHRPQLINVRETAGSGPRIPGTLDYHHELSHRDDTSPSIPEPDVDDDALIVYTSGTTGQPKAVLLSQGNLLVDAQAIAEWHGLTPNQRMMCVLPIHHVNGTVVTLITPMFYGGSVVLNQKFHAKHFFERILNDGVHVVSVVPTLLQFLLHEHSTSITAPTLRHIICGAGPLTVELAAQFEDRFGIPIVHGYGLSETTCYSCFIPADLSSDEHKKWMREFGFPSIGIALPVNEMDIHEEHGSPLPSGSKGEIVIRGYNVMKEYYANTEVNEKAFTFGWFRSGDEGFWEKDASGRRYFFITGRIKELIIRGGVNISPFEIDEVLMSIPGVKAGLAVGFENDWYGEEVGAYIQPASGSTITPDDVLHHCRQYFPGAKSPKVVVFGEDVPVTSTGKYQRSKLRHLFAEWKTVQFKK